MLTKNFSLLFYLKKRSNYSGGKLPIYIRITINGSKEDVRVLNAYLDTLRAKAYEIHRRLVEADQEI